MSQIAWAMFPHMLDVWHTDVLFIHKPADFYIA